jgi:uncharacterized protein (TIGR00251 family)
MFKIEGENFYNFKDNKTYIKVRVTTKSSANKINGSANGALAILVTSVPENNRANMDVIKLLSKQLHIAKSKIRIISGDRCRNKTICIDEKIDMERFFIPCAT